MPKLRHKSSGVVVNVDEASAATLGSEWAPLEAPKKEEPKKPAPRKRTAK